MSHAAFYIHNSHSGLAKLELPVDAPWLITPSNISSEPGGTYYGMEWELTGAQSELHGIFAVCSGYQHTLRDPQPEW